MGLREVRVTDNYGRGGYEPRDIYPQLARYKSDPGMLRQYVEDCLVELAAQGELHVTDVLNQEQRLIDVAGDVILGLDFDRGNGNARYSVEIPDELMTYRVKLKRVGGHQLRWKMPGRPVANTKVIGRYSNRYQVYDQRYMESDSDQETVSLAVAYRALKQYGKYCRTALGEDRQKRLWRFAEVMPSQKKAVAK